MRSDEIGERIRQLRAKRGLTQLKLAGAANVDASMLSKVERQVTIPSVDWLEKIAPALGAVLVLELVEAKVETAEERNLLWAQHVDAYLRSPRGASTPAWAAAQLMARRSHLEARSDIDELVHATRTTIEDQTSPGGAPTSALPSEPRRSRK